MSDESELRTENERLRGELARTRARMTEVERMLQDPVSMARELLELLEAGAAS